MRPFFFLVLTCLCLNASSQTVQDWTLLIPPSDFAYGLHRDENLYDRNEQRIYFRNTDAGILGYVDLNTNTIENIPSTGWFGRMDEMVLDPVNNILYGWRAGKSTVYSIPTTGGTWTAVSPSSSDASHYHGQCYWNPLNEGVGFFGGYGFSSMKNSIHEIPSMTGNWTQKRGNTNTGNPPRAWCWMSLNETGDELYIYGQHGNINGSQYQYPLTIIDGSNYNWARGLWKINLTDYSISTIIPLDDPAVLQYTDIAFDFINNRLFVSGGRLLNASSSNTNQGITTNITQFYDLNNPDGFELHEVGTAYPAEGGALWFDGTNNRLLHYGESGLWALSLNPPAPVEGCTDTSACNYDVLATLDDGSCIDPTCDDSSACNYDANAICGGGTCIPSGCMEEGACNYNAAAECEGETCDYSCCPGPGCCGAGTHWDAALATCVVEVPDTVDAACTLMTLQELASGYAALVEQNAALDSLLLVLQANLDTCTGNLDNTANNALDGPCAGENHVTYQGHNYGIIEIGDQCWFSENLDVEWFRDGSPIAHLQGTSEWLTTDAAGWCYPEDASGNALETWGRLYNFWVVGNNICPSGWHIPNFAEWFEGGNLKPWYEGQHPANDGMTGGAMKVPGTLDWIAPNSGATNELGWNGRPSGSRDLDGQFSSVGTIATYHINNTFGGGEAHHTVLSTGSTDLYRISPWRGDAPETWHMGTAIRCVKN